MHQQYQSSIEIPAAHLEALSKLIFDLEAALSPYVDTLTLSPEEENTILKMNDQSLAVVNKSLGYSKTNPRFIPSYSALSVSDIQVDINALKLLQPLLKQMQMAADSLDDALMHCAAKYNCVATT
jgi:hypothetical protein